MSNKYQEIINLSKKNQESEKSKGRKILELQGYEFNDDGDVVVDLITETNNGKKNFGRITYDAYNAVKGNTLDSYKPKNEEEKKVLDGYKQYTGLFTNTDTTKGNETTGIYADTNKFGKGNIDLTDRPVYVNPDGKISTVSSMSINEDGKEILIPTIVKDENGNAKKLTEDEAIEHYHKTGQYLGKFDTIEEANEYAQNLHIEQQEYYKNPNASQETPTKKDGFGSWLGKQAMAGLGQFNKGVTATLDFILPTEFLGRYDFISKLNDYYSNSSDYFNSEAQQSSASRGKGWKTAGDVVSGTVAALPNAILAYMSAGTSLGATGTTTLATGATALTSGASVTTGTTVSALKQVVNTTMRNPAYWTSAMRTLGTDYEEAKERGASDTVAAMTAIVTTALNAGIEVGSGIEQLPNVLKQQGKNTTSKVVMNWVKSTLDEGGEEVLQGITTNAMAKLMYDHDAPLLSTTDDKAVLNPVKAAKEFGMGVAVGGLLGGGQATVATGINTAQYIKTGKLFKDADAVQAIVDTGLESPKNSTAFKLAEKAQQKLGNKGKLSNYEIGKLYFANVEQIREESAEETTAVEETSITETPTVSEKETVVEPVVENTPATEPVAVEQKNTFTEELDEISSTEMPTVNAGDTFVDSTTNNILRVVSRDDTTTTIEITTPSGKKSTIARPNKGADTLAIDDRYTKTDNSTTTSTVSTTEAESPAEAVVPQAKAPTNITLTKVGEFYEAYGDSAVQLSESLELTPFRKVVNGVETTAVGFPVRYLDSYTNKLGDGYNFTITETPTTATTEAENSTVTEESVVDDEVVATDDIALPEGEILSLKHTRNIYSLFKGSKNIVVGKDVVSDGFVAIPLTDKNLEGVKKVAKDAIIQNNDNFSLDKLYHKDNDVVIQGNPKITPVTGGQGYVFKVGDSFYVCNQKYIDAFNNGKNVITANKNATIPWTVHDENGNFVALFMGAKKPAALNDETFEKLQSVSDVLEADKQKKAEKSEVGLNRNEINLFKKGPRCMYGEINSQKYITNGYVILAVNESESSTIAREYETYNSNGGSKATEVDLGKYWDKYMSWSDIGTVSDIKVIDADKKIVACVVNDIGFTFNKDFVNLLKKRGNTLKILSNGTFAETLLATYNENGDCMGIALPVRNDTETIDGLKMFTGNGLPKVESTVSKRENVVEETKPVEKSAEEVLNNQPESVTIEEKPDKESVENVVSGEYDTIGEDFSKDDGEQRDSKERNRGGNIASSTDSERQQDKTGTLNIEKNDNKISDYEKGVVKKVYHGSPYQFEHFEKSYVDVGIHFGTEEQALSRVGDDGVLQQRDLILKNPLECNDIFGERTPDKYVDEIIENSKLSKIEKSKLKETYLSYCKNKVSEEMVTSLESKINSGKYQIDMEIGKDGVFVSISLMDDLGRTNQIPMMELISVDVLKNVFGEKTTETLLQSKEVPELIKKQLSSIAFEFATNLETNYLKLRKIEEILRSFGYDGFVYQNENEGDGWSYAVFDDSQIIRVENDVNSTNKENIKDDESQSEVLAGESKSDDRGLQSEAPETSEQGTTEIVDGQSGENSGETLPQSTGTDGDRPDVRNDSEGVHGRNDADNAESETTGNATEIAEETPETIETEDSAIEKKRPSNKENFVITDDVAREFDNTPPKAEDNIKAIELLLTLENEGRPATAEEKKILAKYKGWGGISVNALPWEQSRKLYDLYNSEQLREMRSSQNNAFFTPTGVIDAMYNGLKRMGFKGGNVLETSMGVGNFFGRMPVAMTAKSALTGVELESYTARIAQYLYPAATVINKPFQDVAIRNGSYDLVIGNVPFGTNKISYNKKKYSLHNYFIISSLDKVKDGGIVAVITSSGTLDSYGVDARSAIMDRADVVACYKLPEKVFSRNANTDTTTDLLILRKRASDAKPSGDSILNVTTTDDGLRLNEYFVKHPENILGTLAKGTNAWGEITTVLDNGDFYDKLNDAMKKLPKDLISGKVELKPIETIVSTSSKPRFFEKNGKIYADDGAGTATTVSQNQEKTIRDYMAVRDAYKDLLAAYDSDMSEADIKPLRDTLTKAYDDFYKKHGAITGDGKKKIGTKKSTNNTFLEADADYYLVSGLERYDSNANKFEKSALFEKDTLRKKKVTSVDVSSDALAVSLNESGRIDFARMSELTGKSEKQLVEELKGEIVLTPEGEYVLTDIYLSGNIYEKLEAVKDKPEFSEQKEMLEKVLPTPKDASSIMVKLGANYIDTKYIEAFSREVFNTRLEVSKNSSGAWLIEGVKQRRYGDILNVKYGCDAFNAIQLLEKVLNDSEITAKKTIKVDGKSVQVFDEKMTEVARQKAEDIKEAFENWIFKDSERRSEIVDKYNRTYNNYRPLDYERIADKLSFDSMDETLKAKLYPHQKKGIARFLFGGNILFAHGVGTGKTFEMIASVMEAKRMGIINKAAMVVPNNKVVDFKNDIARAYPNAKVLVIDTANKKRQTMLGLVNSNDWDIVLIARTTFTKIPVGAELQSNYINQQLEELDRQILEAEQDRNISKRKLKGLYTQRDNLEQKLKDLDSETKRDENSVDFEKLGFDCICVDEAHNYKSITTMTKLDIKGLASGGEAQQANDMLMKLDYLRSINGRIIFGTGTPITNTVSEIYNMMRMVRPDILEDAGIHSLDEWVNTFAKIETHTEIGVDNKVKNKSTQTIRSFVNGTEMVGMFRQFADVVFTQDVVKNLPKAIPVVIELEGTEELRQIESTISSVIANASGKETLSAYTKAMAMANAASIDLKMLSGAESDVNIFKDYSVEELEYENSKINTMCNYVYDEYKASNDIKGTQIIFCDGGAGSGNIYSFNVHNDIMQKLIERGIPQEEIVIVKNQKDAQLEELFDKVNSGEVRVLIGTSRKMAEGLNVQKRVVAIHHPTVTFKPSDLEQGDARGVRAGNINEEVKIYRYLQGNTFDSYKWQAIDRKGEMINRALRGESVDELEDIGADDEGGAGVDAATAMAITSGNPLVKEKIDIDKEVKRLKTLKQNYMNEYYRYQDAVSKNPSQIRRLTEYSQRIEQDIALRDKYGDKATISINGQTFEKQSDTNKALVEAVKKAPKNGQFTKIGEYNGFDIMFKGDTGGLNYSLVVKGANEYSVEYAGSGNNIARIGGVLNRLDAELERVKGKVEQLKSDLEFAKQEVDKPFEKEKDLTEALEKQKDITYRYEHFGENQNNEQTETAEIESDETVYSSRDLTDNDNESRWTTERVEGNNTKTKFGKAKEKVIDVVNKAINKVNEIPKVNIPNIETESVNISEIVKMIKDNFDIPIATGKVTDHRASGIYKERAEAIRTRIANNLPTIFHELGHHLDKLYKLSKLDSVKKLRKSVSQEYLDQYPDKEKNGEAVAEFVRTYLKNTNEAKDLCPEFYNDFVKTLSKDDLKAVDIIANVSNEYMSSSFSERVRASIVSGDVKEKTSLKEKAKKMHADWVDGFLPIKDVVDYVEETNGEMLSGGRNAYTLATNSLNARAIANFNTVHGFRDLGGNIVKGAKSYIECIADVDKKDLSTLDEYLVLKHSLEWIAPKQEDATKKRVFADDTLEDVESIERRIAEIEYEHPEMKKAADNLYEYQRNILKHIVMPAGGMTEDTFGSLYEKYPCYVPFYRAIGKDGSKTKGSFANQKSPLKRAKGSGALIISPLESIIKNTDKMVKFALRNQTMQVLADYADTVDGFGKFMEKVPPDMLPHTINISDLKNTLYDAIQSISLSSDNYFAITDEVDKIFGDSVTDFTPIANANKKIVTVLNNGTFSYYQIHDEDLYSAIAEFTPKNLEGLFAVSHKIMQPMKMLITQNNPIFALTNALRDIGTAYKHSHINNPIEFAQKYVLALKALRENSDITNQWRAMGGGHDSELSANIDGIKRTLRAVAEKDMGKARRIVYSIFLHPIQAVASMNDYIESIPRLMEFMRTLETGGDLQQAIFNADDITTNFKKSGRHIKAKQANAVIMFNNASLQGLDKTYRTLTNKNKDERNKTLLKWALSALLMAAIQMLWNKSNDDEGYENLSSYKKNNFYNFSIGDGMFISIPKARETAVLDSFTERTIEYVFGNDEAFYDFGGYIAQQILPPMLPDTLNPIDATHDILGSTILGGIADVGWNKNYMDIPIEGKYDEYLPSNERYNENTSQLAYSLGQTKLARKANLSPKKIDHLISSYTGVVGQAINALLPMNKERRDATIGLRNKFVADSNYSTDLLNKMYDNKDAAELEWQYDNNINNAMEYEKNAVITSYISGMNKAIKALPESEQREGRKYLLKTLNNWNYDMSAEQKNMISRLENESIDIDYIFEELPSSKLEWSQNKQKYTYQMTPQEYNEYVNLYLKAIENARKQYGNSSEGYVKAKEATKDYMSKHKKGLTNKYQSKATKVE